MSTDQYLLIYLTLIYSVVLEEVSDEDPCCYFIHLQVVFTTIEINFTILFDYFVILLIMCCLLLIMGDSSANLN